MIYFFIETYNKILNRKKKFKLVAYVNLVDGSTQTSVKEPDDKTDKLMETFEVESYSKRMAYREVVDALEFKHGKKFGADIRFVG